MSYSNSPTVRRILNSATQEIRQLDGQTLDVLDVTKPPDIVYASHLAKVISKLSPLIGNMIEFYVTNLLNSTDWDVLGQWIRQDPDFPDVVFRGGIEPEPGFEIKTWFPLATEITARFRESITHFLHNQTDVVLIAWIPEFLIYGKPKVVGIWRDTAKSLAQARDAHYHRPPHYLVFEPEDTSARTANLQQTNTNGYVFQGSDSDLSKAEQDVRSWGSETLRHDVSPSYQRRLHELRNMYSYRLDTNFAKMDRIEHSGLEEFKAQILSTPYFGYTLREWGKRDFLRSEGALALLL